MIDLAEVKDILLDERDVGAVTCSYGKSFQGKKYSCLVFCDLLLSYKRYPIAIGIDDNWKTELFDFYIRNYSTYPFIPHVSNNGKICLFDLEGALIDWDFEGLLKQCVRQAISILQDGFSEKNKLDLMTEFNAYWCELPGCLPAKIEVPSDSHTGLLKYIHNVPKRKRHKDNFRRNSRKSILYACPAGNKMFEEWNIQGTQKNGLFIRMKSEKYIFPPDPRKPLSVDFINYLLGFIDKKSVEKNIRKIGKETSIIFDISQPNGIRVQLGILCGQMSLKESENQIILDPETKITPLDLIRMDTEYLQKRTEDGINPIKGKHILLVGCGSIGGYISCMLAKSGCDSLTLVDNDLFREENIFRHVLGKSYVNYYKSVALSRYLQESIPGISVKSTEGKIEELVLEDSIVLNDYDLIVAATGNHIINRWMNNYLLDNCLSVPVVYVWNEPLDIGCHALLVDYSSCEGDLEKIFSRDEAGTLFDRTAYCSHKHSLTRQLQGCGSSFVPYGSEISIQAALISVDIIKKMYTGRIHSGHMISYKGSGFYFHKAGMHSTQEYTRQSEQISEHNIFDLQEN